MTRTLPLLVLLAVGLALFLGWPRGTDTDDRGDAGAASPRTDAARPAELRTGAAGGSAAPAQEPAPSSGDVGWEYVASFGGLCPLLPWRVRIEGMEPEDVPDAVVRLLYLSDARPDVDHYQGPPWTYQTDRECFYALTCGLPSEVSFHVDSMPYSPPPEGPHTLVFRVEHPGYFDGEATLLSTNKNAPVVTIHVERAAVIAGFLRFAGEELYAGGIVGAFPFEDDVPNERPVATCALGPYGTYRMKLPRGGRYLIAARGSMPRAERLTREVLDHFATYHGWPQPRDVYGAACVAITVAPGAVTQVPPLVLPSGSALKGHVSLAGGPVPSVVLEAAPFSATMTPLRLGKRGLFWIDGVVAPARSEAVTDRQGNFAFRGLPQGRYRVRVRGSHTIHQHHARLRVAWRTVDVPIRGVEFALALGTVRLRTRVADGAALDITASLTPVGGVPGLPEGVAWETAIRRRVAPDAVVTWQVTPGTRYVIRAESHGYEPWSTVFTAPGVGATLDRVAVLGRKAPQGGLRVHIQHEPGPEVAHAGFGLYPRGSDRRAQFASLRRDLETRDDKAFVLTDLPPGPWTLVVRPGQGWLSGRGHYLPIVTPIVIPAGGEAEVTLHAVAAGRLALKVSDAEGRPLGATCRIVGPHGELVPAQFILRTQDGGTILSYDALPDSGSHGAYVRVSPALAAGPYTLKFRLDGYGSTRKVVDVTAGKTTRVEVKLDRRR